MASDYKLTSYRQDVLSALQLGVKLALESIGKTAVGYAQDDCPVDTGRLKGSIDCVTKGNSVYIGTNVNYAKYVEFGDRYKHKNGKAHFLRDAATRHGDEYKAIAETALKE